MTKTVYEEGLEAGIEKGMEMGMEKGIQDTLLRLGRKRFGPPAPQIEEQVRAIQGLSRLENLIERMLEVSSWDELLAEDANPA